MQNILKTGEDFGKTMNEDSRGLGRYYKERNYVPRHLVWKKIPRKTKKQAITRYKAHS